MAKRTKGSSSRQTRPKAPDPRLIVSTLEEDTVVDGATIEKGSFVVQIGTLETPDGSWWFHVPEPVAFYLIEAAKHRTAGERVRRKLLGDAKPDATGFKPMENSPAVLDAVSHLVTAVHFALAAIEANANGAITDAPDDATVAIEREGRARTVGRSEMEAELDLAEKLAAVPPLVGGRPLEPGSEAWNALARLLTLRDKLVHVNQRSTVDDPHDPGPFALVLHGGASTCVEDAVAVIDATEPDRLDGRVREHL
jgi:hypothetical protein